MVHVVVIIVQTPQNTLVVPLTENTLKCPAYYILHIHMSATSCPAYI